MFKKMVNSWFSRKKKREDNSRELEVDGDGLGPLFDHISDVFWTYTN